MEVCGCYKWQVSRVTRCTRGVPLEARRRHGGRRESNTAHPFSLTYLFNYLIIYIISIYSLALCLAGPKRYGDFQYHFPLTSVILFLRFMSIPHRAFAFLFSVVVDLLGTLSSFCLWKSGYLVIWGCLILKING
jgi:hypothetical protein